MTRLLLVLFTVLLVACDGSKNSDGSSKSTYSSCKIINSDALFAGDRAADLKQCWDAPGKGYSSQGDALAWCGREVNNYISKRYIFGHTVEFAVESTYCP